jgi:polar amino acid transport system substrate-binding protein
MRLPRRETIMREVVRMHGEGSNSGEGISASPEIGNPFTPTLSPIELGYTRVRLLNRLAEVGQIRLLGIGSPPGLWTRLASFARARKTAAKLVLGVACLQALAGFAAADKLDEIRARGKLLVGVSDTSPPFSFREDNRVVGYDVDLAAEVAKRLALPMETVSILNSDRIPALQQDRVDLAASGMTRAANQLKDISFSLAYLVSPHKVLIRRDRGIRSAGQLSGRLLALVKGASVDAELRAAVPNLQIVFFQSYDECFNALRDREVDGFLADEVRLASFAQKSGAAQDFTFIPDYELPRTAGFGIKKNEPRFAQFVDQLLLDLEKSGGAERIFNAWFAPTRRPFRIQPD